MRACQRRRLTVLAAEPQKASALRKISTKHLLVTAWQSCILDMHSIRRLQQAAQQQEVTARAIGQHVREDEKCTTVSQTAPRRLRTELRWRRYSQPHLP